MTTNASITVRRLREEDVPTVAQFEREIAEISFPDDPVTDERFYSKKLRNALHEKKSWPLIAEGAGQIVGWAWFAKRENFITGEVYADLRSFYVIEGKRGAGVAFTFMRMIIGECKSQGFTRIVGRTSAVNEAMQAVYKVYGYQPRHIVYELDLAKTKI
jgi:GNAT superfamily N-acetyltransferase